MKILSTMALFLSLLLWSNVAQALKCECKKANCEKMNDVRMKAMCAEVNETCDLMMKAVVGPCTCVTILDQMNNPKWDRVDYCNMFMEALGQSSVKKVAPCKKMHAFLQKDCKKKR